MKIDEHHHVPVRRKQFEVPAITPFVSERNFRPAMHDKLHWIFFVRIEIRRLDQPALHFVAVSAGEPEGFEWRHRDLRENGVVDMRHSKIRILRCAEVAASWTAM